MLLIGDISKLQTPHLTLLSFMIMPPYDMLLGFSTPLRRSHQDASKAILESLYHGTCPKIESASRPLEPFRTTKIFWSTKYPRPSLFSLSQQPARAGGLAYGAWASRVGRPPVVGVLAGLRATQHLDRASAEGGREPRPDVEGTGRLRTYLRFGEHIPHESPMTGGCVTGGFDCFVFFCLRKLVLVVLVLRSLAISHCEPVDSPCAEISSHVGFAMTSALCPILRAVVVRTRIELGLREYLKRSAEGRNSRRNMCGRVTLCWLHPALSEHGYSGRRSHLVGILQSHLLWQSAHGFESRREKCCPAKNGNCELFSRSRSWQ